MLTRKEHFYFSRSASTTVFCTLNRGDSNLIWIPQILQKHSRKAIGCKPMSSFEQKEEICLKKSENLVSGESI